MNVNGDNAGAPNPGFQDLPSFTVRPAGYVIMLPQPPIPLTPQDDEPEPECCNDGESTAGPNADELKKEAADMKTLEKMNQKISIKEISLNQHDEWLDEAAKAVLKVQEHITATKASRDTIQTSYDSFKTRRDEIMNKYKRDHLVRKLKLAKTTLESLEAESGGLRAAGNGLEAAQKNIEAKVSLLADQLNLQRGQVEDKMHELGKSAEKLTTVVKNFEEYSPDHIALIQRT
jgi:uncharacterized phage infection (PIP) family protein YhgE